jgi:hypothetical protein
MLKCRFSSHYCSKPFVSGCTGDKLVTLKFKNMSKEIVLTVKEGDLFVIKSETTSKNYIVKFYYDNFLEKDEIMLSPIQGGEELKFNHAKGIGLNTVK